MTLQRDRKKLIRARMRKTGESYTAARLRLLAKPLPTPEPPAAPPAAEPPKGREGRAPKAVAPNYAALAGMSDAAIKASTGCDWTAWVGALDYAGAADLSHRAIAELVRKKFGIGGWWSQTVTVGYERIKGLREVGQRRGATDRSFDANKSRTFAVPVAELYRAWADARLRKKWLPEAGITVRKATPERSLRITWSDGTSVELWFVAKGAGKSAVQVQHRKLPNREAIAERKAYWSERLDALADQLR
jgi:uncharacterized protein YndB with AHSA1/START domain